MGKTSIYQVHDLKPECTLLDYGSDAYRHFLNLRDEVLRKPLGFTFTPEFLEREKSDMLIGCIDAGHPQSTMLGGCILSKTDREDTWQLRQMAVATAYQGLGVGTAIVKFAEHEAKRRQVHQLILHARAYAKPFYAKLGYQVYGEEFEEVGISHVHMHKFL